MNRAAVIGKRTRRLGMSGEYEKIPTYVGAIQQNAAFATVDCRADVHQQLNFTQKNDKCAQAKAQFMAVLLNLASGRLTLQDKLLKPTSEVKTVLGFIHYDNLILSKNKPTHKECVAVQALADGINNGRIIPVGPRPCDGVPPIGKEARSWQSLQAMTRPRATAGGFSDARSPATSPFVEAT